MVLGFINGYPVYETRAIIHDPHTGQFTSSGSGGSAARNKSIVDHVMQHSHPDHAIGKTIQHLIDKGSKVSKAQDGKSPVHIDGDHVGHVAEAKSPIGHVAWAHHTDGSQTLHKNKKEAIQALGERHFKELAHKAETAAAVKRSTKIREKHGVPEFKDAKHAADWLASKHPNIKFNLDGQHLSNAQVNAEQFHKLASEHKWAAKTVSAITSEKFTGLNAPWGAAQTPKGGRTSIELNRERFNAPSHEVYQHLKADKKSGYSAADHPESVLTHEFGHAAHSALHDAASKHGIKAKLVEWEKSAFGNKKERASDYGKTNTQEAFAESFAQMHHTPKEAWAPSTHKLAALVEHFNSNHPEHKESWNKL